MLREGGRIVNVSVVATAVQAEGEREVLGIDVGTSEDGAFWLAFLRGLLACRLSGVELVTSDAHEGLKDAIATVFPGGSSTLRLPWVTRSSQVTKHRGRSRYKSARTDPSPARQREALLGGMRSLQQPAAIVRASQHRTGRNPRARLPSRRQRHDAHERLL